VDQEAQSGPSLDSASDRDETVGVSSPQELLTGLQNGTIKPTWDNRKQLVALIGGWYADPGAGRIDALRGLGEWQLGRAYAWTEYELSDALWQACLTQGLNDLAYPLLVDAQASGHGWSKYFTSREKSVARQEAILTHFRGRALEFVLDSLFAHGTPSGVGQAEVLCSFLCRAGQPGLAFRICDEVVDFVRSLSADCPMRPVKWAAADRSDLSAMDILVGRLTSPEDNVKARAAFQLSRLSHECDEPADVIGKIIEDMRANDVEWLRYPHMLALHLIAEESPQDIAPHSSELREMWSEATILGRFLFDALCQLSGLPGQRIGPELERPELATVQATPEWFAQIMDNYRVLHQLPEDRHLLRAGVLARAFVYARNLGLDEDRILSLEGPTSRFSDFSQGTRCPADNMLGAILRTSYLRALAEVPRDVAPRDDDILFWALRTCPFDRSMARIDAGPRPDGMPEDSGPADTPASEVTTVQMPNWDQVLRLGGLQGQVLLGCNLNMWHGNASEETRVFAFMYETSGGALPSAGEVFHAIDGIIAVSGVTDMAELDRAGELGLLHALAPPLLLGDLSIVPVVGRMGLFSRRWFPVPSMFPPIVVLPGKRLMEELGICVFDGRLRYQGQAGEAVGTGFYWQDGMPSHIQAVHNVSAGFILQFGEEPVNRLLDRAGLRLGWVRRSERRFTKSLSDDKPQAETEFVLHGISAIILP